MFYDWLACLRKQFWTLMLKIKAEEREDKIHEA